MSGLLRSLLLGCLVLFAWTAGFTPAAVCCPFCDGQGKTLLGDAEMADFIAVGSLKEVHEGKTADEDSTKFVIDTVIKDNALRGAKKEVILPRFLADPSEGKNRYLVYCNVYQKKLDPSNIVIVGTNGAVAKYLTGMLELQTKSAPIEKRLLFAFDYLDSADKEVSNDAYKEFANASYKEYAGIAKTLPADRIAKWMKDEENTPAFRLGLYGSMLGHCGKEEHAALLRSLVDDPEKRAGSGVDGILAGYVMLKPKEGWQYVRSILGDRKNDFMFRYAALRAARFFHDNRTDLVKKEDVAEGISQMLPQHDISDLAIEDLRKWERWEMTDRVLALQEKRIFGLFHQPAYDTPIVRRAMLRFALSAEKHVAGAAAAYVAEQRKSNPAAVKDSEEILRLEQPTPATK